MSRHKLKLKGTIVEKLPEKKKQKMKKTLEKMEDIREKDSRYLRDQIQTKLTWALDERKKGIAKVEEFKEQIQNLVKKVTKLTGAIAILQELIIGQELKEEKK